MTDRSGVARGSSKWLHCGNTPYLAALDLVSRKSLPCLHVLHPRRQQIRRDLSILILLLHGAFPLRRRHLPSLGIRVQGLELRVYGLGT